MCARASSGRRSIRKALPSMSSRPTCAISTASGARRSATREYSLNSLARALVAALLVGAGGPAAAQGEAFGLLHDHGVTPDEMAPARDAEPRLRLVVGGGIAAAPRFAGSDNYHLRPLPVIAA